MKKEIFIDFDRDIPDEDWAMILRYIRNKIGTDNLNELRTSGHKK